MKRTPLMISALIPCVQIVQIWLPKDMVDMKRVFGYTVLDILGQIGLMNVHIQIGLHLIKHIIFIYLFFNYYLFWVTVFIFILDIVEKHVKRNWTISFSTLGFS
uniref:Uncharacterized protein n=1 Tax=Cannabis sativa TaxID=3483 RepID=A0A803QXS9_CANSA